MNDHGPNVRGLVQGQPHPLPNTPSVQNVALVGDRLARNDMRMLAILLSLPLDDATLEFESAARGSRV
jgi:hypothetical protein